jgi:hypothetical protein
MLFALLKQERDSSSSDVTGLRRDKRGRVNGICLPINIHIYLLMIPWLSTLAVMGEFGSWNLYLTLEPLFNLVLRFENHHVFDNPEEVLNHIRKHFGWQEKSGMPSAAE